jgi:alanyl-tRNA synthetase
VRIEYSAGEAAVVAVQAQEELIKKAAATLKVPPEKLPHTVERFFEEWKQLKNENERLGSEIARQEPERLKKLVKSSSGGDYICEVVSPPVSVKELRKISSHLEGEEYLTMLIGRSPVDSKVHVLGTVPANRSSSIDAAELVKPVAEMLGGSSGGTAMFAQGGGDKLELMEKAREEGSRVIEEKLQEEKLREEKLQKKK